MKDKYYLYQHKQVQKGTERHTIKMSDLQKLKHHAVDEHKEPCYMIDDENSGDTWYMLNEFMFNELMEVYYESRLSN